MLILISILLCIFAPFSFGETLGQYLSQNGHYTPAFDLNLGLLNTLPSGNSLAKDRLGARLGLSYEFSTTFHSRLQLPINLAFLYNVKSVQIEQVRWNFSEVKMQLLTHHTLSKNFSYLEPVVFISPGYTLDLVLSGNTGNIPAESSLGNRFNLDLGGGILINISVLRARAYYAYNLIRTETPGQFSLSSLGLDLLLPLSQKRKP